MLNVSHDSSVGKWTYLTNCPPLPVTWVQFPGMVEFFKICCLAVHTLPTCPEPAWQKIPQYTFNGTTQPVAIKKEGCSPTMDLVAENELDSPTPVECRAYYQGVLSPSFKCDFKQCQSLQKKLGTEALVQYSPGWLIGTNSICTPVPDSEGNNVGVPL